MLKYKCFYGLFFSVGFSLALTGCLGENDGAPEGQVTMFAVGGAAQFLSNPNVPKIDKIMWQPPTEEVMKAQEIFAAEGISISEVRCAFGQPPMPSSPPGTVGVAALPAEHFVLVFKTAKHNLNRLKGWQVDPGSKQRFLVDEFGNYDLSLVYPFDTSAKYANATETPFVELKYADCDELRKSAVFANW